VLGARSWVTFLGGAWLLLLQTQRVGDELTVAQATHDLAFLDPRATGCGTLATYNHQLTLDRTYTI